MSIEATLIYRKMKATLLRAQSPGYGFCYRCGTPWNHCESHTTFYSENSGCFPLCETCWSELTSTERVPFYRQMWDSWQTFGVPVDPKIWDQIEIAVMEGK